MGVLKMKKAIGVVAGGGNVATWQKGLQGILEVAHREDRKVIVFSDGFTGINEGRFYLVNPGDIDENLPGIFSGSSRDALDVEKARDLKNRLKKEDLELIGIIGMCGDDHLKQLYIAQTHLDIPVMGWPKTMDNDLSKTLCTMGYITAASNAAEAARRGALAGYNYNRAHIITYFGRYTDWVVAAAGLWGFADIVVGCELEIFDPHTICTKLVQTGDRDSTEQVITVGYSLDYIIEETRKACKNNKERYGKYFAVVVVAEAGKIYGLADHIDRSDLDSHGHPKLNPENLYLSLRKAFKKAEIDVSGQAITYNELRFAPAAELDAELSKQAGIEAANALLSGEAGKCVVLSHDGSKFHFGLEPLPEVYKRRCLRPEGWMDYANLTVNPDLEKLYNCILGPVGKREEYLYKRLEEKQV